MDIDSAVTNRGFCAFNTLVFDFVDPFNLTTNSMNLKLCVLQILLKSWYAGLKCACIPVNQNPIKSFLNSVVCAFLIIFLKIIF